MALDCLEDGGAAVLEQVPAAGDMDRLRGAASPSLSIAAAAIARDDLDAGVLVKPCREGISGAVWQEIDDALLLKIDKDRAATVTAPPCPVVDADDAQTAVSVGVVIAPSHEAQQRVAAGRHAAPPAGRPDHRRAPARPVAECRRAGRCVAGGVLRSPRAVRRRHGVGSRA